VCPFTVLTLQKILESHVINTKYMLQITTREGCKCPLCDTGFIDRSSISKDVLDEVQLVACPEPMEAALVNDDVESFHYKPYDEVRGKLPNDKHRPSLLVAQKERAAKVVKKGGAQKRSRIGNGKSGELQFYSQEQISADERNKAVINKPNYIRHFVTCGEAGCYRKQVVYSKDRLSPEEKQSITASCQDWWECGQPLYADASEDGTGARPSWVDKAFVAQKVTCDHDISLHYLKVPGLSDEQKKICGNCGIDLSDPAISEKFEVAIKDSDPQACTMALQCLFCQMDDRKRVMGRLKPLANETAQTALKKAGQKRHAEGEGVGPGQESSDAESEGEEGRISMANLMY